jgi:MFS family permease
MLIIGMIVGPIIGLLLADYIERSRAAGPVNWLVTWGVLILFLIFIAFAGFFSLEVRVGVFFGTLLGVLIGFTPIVPRAQDRPQ